MWIKPIRHIETPLTPTLYLRRLKRRTSYRRYCRWLYKTTIEISHLGTTVCARGEHVTARFAETARNNIKLDGGRRKSRKGKVSVRRVGGGEWGRGRQEKIKHHLQGRLTLYSPSFARPTMIEHKETTTNKRARQGAGPVSLPHGPHEGALQTVQTAALTVDWANFIQSPPRTPTVVGPGERRGTGGTGKDASARSKHRQTFACFLAHASQRAVALSRQR